MDKTNLINELKSYNTMDEKYAKLLKEAIDLVAEKERVFPVWSEKELVKHETMLQHKIPEEFRWFSANVCTGYLPIDDWNDKGCNKGGMYFPDYTDEICETEEEGEWDAEEYGYGPVAEEFLKEYNTYGFWSGSFLYQLFAIEGGLVGIYDGKIYKLSKKYHFRTYEEMLEEAFSNPIADSFLEYYKELLIKKLEQI